MPVASTGVIAVPPAAGTPEGARSEESSAVHGLLCLCSIPRRVNASQIYYIALTGRVERRRDRFRPMASCVSALSSIVAKGHQVVPTIPLPPRLSPSLLCAVSLAQPGSPPTGVCYHYSAQPSIAEAPSWLRALVVRRREESVGRLGLPLTSQSAMSNGS